MTARLRIQELPSEVNGDNVAYPFVWVLDRVGDYLPAEVAELARRLDQVGGPLCRGAVVFPGAVELADDPQPAIERAQTGRQHWADLHPE